MVRPVDLQDNLSKAPMASRLQHLQQNAPEMAHRQAGKALAQQQLADQSRPLPSSQSGGVALHPDQGKQGGRRRPPRSGTPAPEASPARQAGSPASAGADDDSPHVDLIA